MLGSFLWGFISNSTFCLATLSLPQLFSHVEAIGPPDTWVPGKAGPALFLCNGRENVGLPSSLCLSLACGGVWWGPAGEAPFPAPRLPDPCVSASLCSESESWSCVWGTSTAWDGRSGVGPLETSTWVSVPNSSSVVLGPLGQHWGQVGGNVRGPQALQPELGSRPPVARFWSFCPQSHARLGVRRARGVLTQSGGGAPTCYSLDRGGYF